jgi:thioredoxin 1
MKTSMKVAIVVLLIVAVAAALLLKARRAPFRTTLPVAPAAGAVAPSSVTSNAAPAAARLPRLVDLGADKCIPCKAMAPILAELRTSLAARVTVEFIDVWQKPDEAKPYNIKLIPTQIFFDAAGNELFRHEGFFSKEDILAKWQELGVELAP